MRAIKICPECYTDNIILVNEGDVIIITDVENCDFDNKKSEVIK